MLGAATAKLW